MKNSSQAMSPEQAAEELAAAHAELRRLYDRLKEADQLRSQFFANVSHELRTPLALILGPVERLLQGTKPGSENGRDLRVVQRNAWLLLRHVEEFLEVARRDSGEAHAYYGEVDLARLVRLACAHFEALAAERGVDFEVAAPGTLRADVDPDKVERILLNLLFNAFKFAPVGGRVRCQLELDPSGEIVDICVADSGPGVPTDLRETIFERFRQIDGGVTRKFGGTGLGLSIARDFADLHGGSIHVGDAREGGASFHVRLPLRAPPGTAVTPLTIPASDRGRQLAELALEELRAGALKPRRPPGPAPSGHPTRPLVLVVEDNPEMNRFLVRVLEEDYRTASASDGAEGLRLASELGPDLVITDVMMPELSGEELVEAMKQDPRLETIPVLVLTAKDDDSLRVNLLRSGANDFVTKPFLAEEVMARVRNLVSHKRARDFLAAEVTSQRTDIETLAREVARQQWELRTALEQMRVARDLAERASKVKSNFLRMMSHELRTPVTAMQLQITLLERDRSAPLTPRQREGVERISRSTRRLLDLIETALEYARVESGRWRARPDPFSLEEVAQGVVAEFQPHAEQKGLRVDLELDGEMPALISDRQLVRLVAVNLVGNAVKHTSEGRVLVRIGWEAERHVLAIHDTGPGIPEEVQAELFDPFQQLSDLRLKHGPGSGLGLVIVNELVRALGGQIHLESRVDAGTTFTVLLPELRPEMLVREAPS